MPGPIRTIHRERIRLLTAFCVLLIVLSAGCKSANPSVQSNASADQHQFTDETGRAVTIKTSPQRIISLAPNLTEMLFALGLGDRVVGVTSYCDFPLEAKSKAKVGDTLQPNSERIIALKPDLVIISTSSQLEKITRQLDELKIPVYITNPRTVREVIASIRNLGQITGANIRAEEFVGTMNRRLDAVEQQIRSEAKPRVFYVLQNSPLITAGKNTFINDLINLAGAQSISGDEAKDYPQFSRETVIARAPEIIIVPQSHGTDIVSESDLRRDFATTPAVRNNRIVRVNPDLIDRPGPRIIDGLEQLAKALHGEK